MLPYQQLVEELARAYDARVDDRAAKPVETWKQSERERFLEMLRAEDKRTLLEVGAGTGVHGAFFAEAGLDVVCTDVSAAMVEHCRARGLTADRRDVVSLGLEDAFDAAFAMNCLLHVPFATLPRALASIRAALRPGGLLYVAQYGGEDFEGTFPDDEYEPKRFFSTMRDERFRETVAQAFKIVDFRGIDVEPKTHVQTVIARRAGAPDA